MHVKIDKFGRLLIPKRIRDRCGLKPGTILRVDVGDEGSQLMLVKPKVVLFEKNGLLVCFSSSTSNFINIVEQVREDRIAQLMAI